MTNDLQPTLTPGIQMDAPLNAHILIAEDYPANVLVATTMLDHLGCTYVIAGNGHEALSLMKREVFDMVFMDVEMPVMNGFIATGLMRKWEKERAKPASIIIGITSHALASHRDKCLAAGMNEYVSKPYQIEDLRDKIEKYKKAPVTQTAGA